MKKVYNKISKSFSETRTFPWPEFKEFLKHIPTNAKVLDIGCGNGRLYNSLQEKNINYTGVDLSDKLLDIAQKKYPNLRFICDDMSQLNSIKNEKFDAIFFIASFHHLESKEKRIKTLLKAKSILSPQGKIFMTNWNLFQKKYYSYIFQAWKKSLFSKTIWNDVYIPFTLQNEKVFRYYHAFTPYELTNLFKEANLSTLDQLNFNKTKKVKHWIFSRNISHISMFG